MRRLREMRDLRSYALSQREVSAVLRMAYDDLRMQRWGLQAKLVHTTSRSQNNTSDRTEVSEVEVDDNMEI